MRLPGTSSASMTCWLESERSTQECWFCWPMTGSCHRRVNTWAFLVLQEIFAAGASCSAEVLLPLRSFAEREGTVTNTKRRIRGVRASAPAVRRVPVDRRQRWKPPAALRRLCRPSSPPTSGRFAHQLRRAELSDLHNGREGSRLLTTKSACKPHDRISAIT